MRETKFRGYNKLKKKWYYGFLCKEYNEEEEDYYYINYEFGSPRVEEESIGQYTGFKDDYGVEIYEGDILEIIDDEENSHYEVYYSKELGEWCAYCEFFGVNDELYKILQCENKVIGNIYEEGLKEDK